MQSPEYVHALPTLAPLLGLAYAYSHRRPEVALSTDNVQYAIQNNPNDIVLYSPARIVMSKIDSGTCELTRLDSSCSF